ncbi:MAG: amidohydrolase family protein [Pirellulales bacterium]
MLYAETGVTTAHEGATHFPAGHDDPASERGGRQLDRCVVAYPFITDVDKVLAEIPVAEWTRYWKRFKIGGVKITLDGSPQGRTAFFTTPYLTGVSEWGTELDREPTFPQDLAYKMVKKVYDLNVPLIIHCNGDAAIDLFLSAYEQARAGDYRRP